MADENSSLISIYSQEKYHAIRVTEWEDDECHELEIKSDITGILFALDLIEVFLILFYIGFVLASLMMC